MNQFNIDECTYEKIKLNILNAFSKSNDYKTSVTVNDLERNVSVKIERENSKDVTFMVFDLQEMGRGFVLIKVFSDPKKMNLLNPISLQPVSVIAISTKFQPAFIAFMDMTKKVTGCLQKSKSLSGFSKQKTSVKL